MNVTCVKRGEEPVEATHRVKMPTPVQRVRFDITRIVELSRASKQVNNLRRLGLLTAEHADGLESQTGVMIDEAKADINQALQLI